MSRKPIPGFPGYLISDSGEVWSVRRNWEAHEPKKKRTYLRGGYRRVSLLDEHGHEHHKMIHRLVLLTFVGPPPVSKPHGRHLDGCPTNNQLDNLAWGSAEDNARDRTWHKRRTYKLSADDVMSIRARAVRESKRSLALEFHVAASTISRIVTGLTRQGPARVDPPRRPFVRADAKLSREAVRQIRTSAEPHTVLARRFAVSATTIRDVRKYRIYAAWRS